VLSKRLFLFVDLGEEAPRGFHVAIAYDLAQHRKQF
jgi:hypothetical protein